MDVMSLRFYLEKKSPRSVTSRTSGICQCCLLRKAATLKNVKERALHVHLSDDEHQKLIEKHGEEKTTELYRILSEWKQDTPKSKWKKSDYRSILRWVVYAVQEKQIREEKLATPVQKQATENKEYTEKITENFNPYIRRNPRCGLVRIESSDDAIVFVINGQSPPKVIKYTEHGFSEQVENELRKRKLL